MSGHSKWSTIKRKKGALDAKRGKVFTKIGREITTAVRLGGGDPGGNPSLRLALANARAANMPKDNQERAIKKGLGELGGAEPEDVVYEGRGPRGSAFLVEVLTDNRNRSVQEIRNAFSRGGGEMLAGGAVMWMFDRTGIVTVPRAKIDEDALTEQVIELGGDDVKDGGEEWIVLCDPANLLAVRSGLESLGPGTAEARYIAKPEHVMGVEGDDAVRIAKLLAMLDDLDDVQTVFTTAELPDDVLEAHGP